MRRITWELKIHDAEEKPLKFSGPEDVYQFLVSLGIRDRERETLTVLLLNRRKELMGYETVSLGTADAAIVHPREVYRAAVSAGADCIIIAHNHPSGDPRPSREDSAVTLKLQEAGEILGIPLQDHIIIAAGNDGYNCMEGKTVPE